MREIKFRAWDKIQNVMFNFDIYNVPPYLGQTHLVGEKFERIYEPMQYTGLKDKNGMVIYEGDIVQTGWQGNEKGVVVFESSTYCVDSGNGYMYFNHPESYEVIGNVYENPELLGDRQ